MADPQPPETTQPGPGPFERWYRVTTSFVGRERWFPPSASACLSCRRRHRSSRRRPGSGCSTAWPGSCGRRPPGGRVALEELFWGLTDELVANGALAGGPAETRVYITGAIKWSDANFAFVQANRLRSHTLWPSP
jgi:hypothetical protein